MTAPAEGASVAALSAAQHKAALWADDRQQVYAVVMGSRIPDLEQRLAGADLHAWDCLLPGALDAAQRVTAPYLLHLKKDAAITDWLLFEAPTALPQWGVLLRSAAHMIGLRNHLRDLCQARLPGGQPIALEWMDRETLAALLAHADGQALAQVFGPVSAFTVAGSRGWQHAALALGALRQSEVPLALAA